MSEKFLLKDILFNKEKVDQLGFEIKKTFFNFEKEKFTKEVLYKFKDLELKARISWIAECLKKYLPNDFEKSVKIILKALPKENDLNLEDNDFGDFIYAPYSEFVAKNGCNSENLEISLNAIYEITKRFSAEDAIRYFINKYPKETLEKLEIWSKDKNYHVRRLCSEGTRPKLPWSQKINIDYKTPIKILDNLFYDKTRFVTRSVSNHLNDISKIDPDFVIDILEKWQKSEKQNGKEMDYIINHSLRTSVKKGNKRAIKMLGFSEIEKLELTDFKITKKVKMNNFLEFSFDLKSSKKLNLVIDYVIYFSNKNAKINSKKVYKLTKIKLVDGRKNSISKRHKLVENMTTRKLYPGLHEIEIKINGEIYKKEDFLLEN